MTLTFTRRTALKAAAAAPIAATLAPSLGNTQTATTPGPLARSFTLGDFNVTTLLAGSAMREGPKPIFGGNVSDEEFARVSEENFISSDALQFYFTPTLVDTGSEKILFDTGLGNGGVVPALAQAGVAPEEINTVVITHMHGDHIGGMTNGDGQEVFTNAAYIAGSEEYNFWSAKDAGDKRGDLVKAKVGSLADKTTFVDDGHSVASGVTSLAAFGHTPGHMVYMLESGGQQMVLTADLANHYVWSFANPDWEVLFDIDKAAAAASRRKVLGMLAADRVPMIGYHMPFPGAGYVETRDSGFRFVPVSYQLTG
ncbi:MAG: MBL fold metallo-hydrolase [Paracoccaceae bacterium]|jgi:glyoxylase-like metal-dependent hydrolase (beta-lactamase superfamily II)